MIKIDFNGCSEEDMSFVEQVSWSSETECLAWAHELNGPDLCEMTEDGFKFKDEPSGILDHSKTNLPTCGDYREMSQEELQARFLAGELGCAEPQRGME